MEHKEQGPITAAKLARLERGGVRQHLLSDREAAEVCGVGERTFADLIGQPWMPQPIILGARLRRWDADELLEALRTRAPRGGKVPMPEQLRRGKIEAMKAGPSGHAAA